MFGTKKSTPAGRYAAAKGMNASYRDRKGNIVYPKGHPKYKKS